jgi:hypothetical protein
MSTSNPEQPELKPDEPIISRDAEYWAKPVTRLNVEPRTSGGLTLNVDGRQVTSPIQGFGKMWQKTYRVRLSGASVTPAEVIATWKEHFPEFWPARNRFHAPLTGVKPGEVALLDLNMPGNVRLSTGVLVLYADEESFTLMTPQGHTFAGWITFSAFEDNGTTVAQAQVLMRASDPMYEIGLGLIGHRMEDRFWEHTLSSVAAYFGVHGQVWTSSVLIDPKRQWRNYRNIWYNALIRSVIYDGMHIVSWPVRTARSLVVDRRTPGESVQGSPEQRRE